MLERDRRRLCPRCSVDQFLAPVAATTIAGYKLESLGSKSAACGREPRADLQEAELLSPARLDQLARQNNLVAPSSGQVFHLEGKPEGAVAMVK